LALHLKSRDGLQLLGGPLRQILLHLHHQRLEGGWLEESHGITKIQQQKRGSMVVISLLYAAKTWLD